MVSSREDPVRGRALAREARWVQVEKTSGLAFLNAADRLWREREVILIGENLGVAPDAYFPAPAGGGWWEGSFTHDRADELAQITSTSGTTGRPKAIAISRRAISDTSARLVEHMAMDAGIREYVGVPVVFSFGLGRARAVAMAGGATYIPEHGFRPDEIARMLREGSINALSAVPTMLRTVLANPDLVRGVGTRLRWLEIGSQYMSAQEKQQVRTLFPEAVILQHYGLTEASRSTFLRIDLASDDELESVGRAVGEGAVRIGEEGRIAVSGPHVAMGVLRDGALEPLVGADNWLETTDLGEMREGLLYFAGRSDDVANVGGIKISAEQFESALAERLGAADLAAVCVIKDDLRGEKLGIAAVPGQLARVHQQAALVAAAAGLRPADMTLVELDALPRTATGKLQRSELATRVAATAAAPPAGRPVADHGLVDEPTARETEIIAIWSEALGLHEIGRHESFYDLGGDSLSAVTVVLRAEQAGLSPDVVQRMFAGETVAQIAAAPGEGAEGHIANLRAVRADALNAVRGLLVLFILLSHWGPFVFERLGEAGARVWATGHLFLRIGTPGFAMVFGMGLAFFFFDQIDRARERLRKRIRTNTLLLTAGLLLAAALRALSFLITGEAFDAIWPERLFYNVILFYALMMPTALFWLRWVAGAKDPVFAGLLLATVALGFHAACVALVPVNPFTGFASLGWHMLVAPYAYPRLLGCVALGLAGALWLARIDELATLKTRSLQAGLIVGGLGFVIVAMMPGGWHRWAGAVQAIMPFAGAVLLLYFGALAGGRNVKLRPLFRIARVIGMLAFPIFIAQDIASSLVEMLKVTALPYTLCVALPVLALAGGIALAGWRIHRLVYGTARTE